MDKLSMVIPYYDNPGMLQLQLATWYSYPKVVREQLEFIIVDDGSPTTPAKEVIGKTELNLRLFRVDKDIPWNQHGARNLGMKHVSNKWVFLTDMDSVLTTDHLIKLQNMEKDTLVYTVGRVRMPAEEPYKYHPNTFLLTKDVYWAVNGYNTHYCGTYGGDGEFARDLKRQTEVKHLEDVWIHYYPRSYLKDSGTNNYERKGAFKDAYRKLFDNRHLIKEWEAINFPWHEVGL